MIKKIRNCLSSLAIVSCTTTNDLPPLDKVPSLDLHRYMGDWYVIANIPTFVEKGAHNAVEHYDLNPDGSVAVTFTFHKDKIDGDLKTYTMTGKIVEGTGNAEWSISPFWPLRFPYYTVELAADYSWVVVGMPSRDHLWIMARQPSIPEPLFADIVKRMVNRGFKESEILKVPQKWPNASSP